MLIIRCSENIGAFLGLANNLSEQVIFWFSSFKNALLIGHYIFRECVYGRCVWYQRKS